ncbi:glycosyltransferase family 2 protein [Paenibacillus sp. PAMC21692]|uniref:glycosyltransferase family 2 protein n=1 Tax=Paenibacillus sp. PAMC21692 TaxID=2762320 RepID=UPI00164E3044|nr:glycosyltransferase family 2 protein [Paenibacillus sp. PAMC21692]QNK58367.1 glycosyltransferase family 2 protein [Paenibacillus sp. PAMC21692]
MTKQTAIVICNWNKKDDVIQCVDAVYQSTYRDFDVLVVDNASSDGSLEALENSPHPIKIIREKINIGGAGGFNSGMRHVLEGNYEFIVLLDNDAFVEPEAIEELVKQMARDCSIGLLGSKLYIHGTENKLQEFGSYLDWSNYQIRVENKGVQDCGQVPSLIECDYVPACALIVRTRVVREAGFMDSDFFIYWDDIEWAYRVKDKGYKVMVARDSKVWHKMGALRNETTFPTYYFWRNRFYFFFKYCSRDNRKILAASIFADVCEAVYLSIYKKQYSSARTIIGALQDALRQVRGQASDNRIMKRDVPVERLLYLDITQERVLLIIDDYSQQYSSSFEKIISILRSHNRKVEVIAGAEVESETSALFQNSFVIKYCESILKQQLNNRFINCYIDKYINIVATDKDKRRIQKYNILREKYKQKYFENMIRQLEVVYKWGE